MKDNKEKEIQELRFRLDKIFALINDFSAYNDSDKLPKLIGSILYYADIDRLYKPH